jgi:hypothetical protein
MFLILRALYNYLVLIKYFEVNFSFEEHQKYCHHWKLCMQFAKLFDPLVMIFLLVAIFFTA